MLFNQAYIHDFNVMLYGMYLTVVESACGVQVVGTICEFHFDWIFDEFLSYDRTVLGRVVMKSWAFVGCVNNGVLVNFR